MKLPTSWADISIEKYLQLYAISKRVTDPLEIELHILAVIKEMSYKEIEAMPLRDVYAGSKQLSFLKEMPVKNKLSLSFRLKGKVYQAVLFHKDMTAGQFIDFSSVCKDVKNEDVVYEMHKLIACMCLSRRQQWAPPFYKYEYEGYKEVAEIFYKEMTMNIAYPYYVFFCKVWQKLLANMPDYLIRKAEREMRTMSEAMKKIV